MSIDALRASLADRYRVDRELGRGGMALVYKARDLKHDRDVAIKVLRPALAASMGVERFVREIGLMGNLRHPHILPMYESGEADSFLYYVMPLVKGETLRELIDRQGQLPVEQAVQLAREVAGALGHAHAEGIIHRDVKPANILLEGGHAVLADFGIARAVGTLDSEKLTASGLSIGTPTYMSPEQSFGESEVDGRSDLYSLGCVLFEMLTGEPPYDGRTPQAVFAKRMSDPVPHVTTMRDTVSPELDACVHKLLAKSAADRFATAEEFIAALDGKPAPAAQATPKTTSVSARQPDPSRRRSMTIAIILFIVLVLGWQWRRQRSGNDTTALSADLVAVLPFTIRGSPDLAYLGDGMVDLMSTKLDGAGSLRTASPRAILASVGQGDRDIATTGAALQVARRLGAGRYVTGEMIEAGGRVQFTAHLFNAPNDRDAPETDPVATATAEGQVGALFELIDSLAFRLVAGTLNDSTANRLARLATSTTSSLPALKAYLEGERLIRNGGRFREAEAAFDEAIRLDSTFALGWYRKSLVADWTDAYDVRSSADRARALAGSLTARDRSLVEALHARRRGQSTEAERLYHEHLRRWPDEVEALVQLGEIMFHDGPRRGHSMMEAIPLYEHALRLEPDNFDARVHIARLYALQGNDSGLAADLRHFEADSSTTAAAASAAEGGERLVELQAMAAFATTDTAAQQAILRRLDGKPYYYWFYAAHAASRFSRNAAGAQRIIARATLNEPLVVMTGVNLLVVRGQRNALVKFMDRVPGGRNASWDMAEAFIWTSGAVALDTARLAALIPRLRGADARVLRETGWITAYEDLTDAFHAFERDYQVILAEIQLGRLADARRDLAALRRTGPLPNLGNLRADAILSLEAELLLQEGDRDGALRTLRQISYETPHASTVHAFADGSRSRYLRAELELERGDTTVAIGFFRGFDESWSPWDSYHRAAAYQRLGEIAEAQGRTDDAIRYYNWLIDLWEDADPSYDARRASIIQHRSALTATRQ